MKKSHLFGVALSLLVVTAFAPLAMSKKGEKAKPAAPDGEAVFKQNCAECHTGGGNTVNVKKPLAGSAKLASIATFKAYLQAPVGHMPYYKHVISDKATLKALYNYCKTLKKSEPA